VDYYFDCGITESIALKAYFSDGNENVRGFNKKMFTELTNFFEKILWRKKENGFRCGII
jgi:hypothetical protein